MSENSPMQNAIYGSESVELIKIKQEDVQDMDYEKNLDSCKVNIDELYDLKWCAVCYKKKIWEKLDEAQNNDTKTFDKSSFCECETSPNYNNSNGNCFETIEIKEDPLQLKVEFTEVSDDEMSEAWPKTNLNCADCNKEYEGYCTTCHMLVQIFHSVLETERVQERIPKFILTIKEKSIGIGVFALKCIPKNVVFGPFNGLKFIQNSSGYKWKIKNGKFVGVQNMGCDNWMHYINCAKNSLSNNLCIFQYENKLYYRSNQKISEGEELLMWFDEDDISKLDNDEEIFYSPHLKTQYEDVYACTFCCLGFRSEVHLFRHKTICPRHILKDTVEDIVQCPNCQIYLIKAEYLERHTVSCSKENEGKHEPQAIPDETKEHPIDFFEFGKTEIIPSTSREDEFSECMYETNDKSKFAKYWNFSGKERGRGRPPSKESKEKVKVDKPYECRICKKKFKRKVHIVDHIKMQHINKNEKKFKCIECHKSNLTRHLYIHGNEEIQCTKCNWKYLVKGSYDRHVKDKHSDGK